MFHLFKRCILYPDIQFSAADFDSVIVSSLTDYDFDTSSLDSNVQLKNSIYSQNYNELMAKYQCATDSELFEFMFRNFSGYNEIYADISSYAIIVSKWFKLLYDQPDPDLVYTIYDLSLKQYYFYCLYQVHGYTDFHALPRQVAIENFKSLTHDEFVEIFNATSFTGDKSYLRDQLKPFISNELKFCSAISTHKTMVDDVLYRMHRFGSYAFIDNAIGLINSYLVDNLVDVEIANLRQTELFEIINNYGWIDTSTDNIDKVKQLFDDVVKKYPKLISKADKTTILQIAEFSKCQTVEQGMEFINNWYDNGLFNFMDMFEALKDKINVFWLIWIVNQSRSEDGKALIDKLAITW